LPDTPQSDEDEAATAALMLGEKDSLPGTPLTGCHRMRVKIRLTTPLQNQSGENGHDQQPGVELEEEDEEGYREEMNETEYEGDELCTKSEVPHVQLDGQRNRTPELPRPGTRICEETVPAAPLTAVSEDLVASGSMSGKRKSPSRTARGQRSKSARIEEQPPTVLTTARVKKMTPKARAARTSYFEDDDTRDVDAETRPTSKNEKTETKQVALMKAAAADAVINKKWANDLVLSSKNDSGYEGVDFHQGKWRARIRTGTSRIVLGRYDTKVEAAQAYAAAFREVPDGMGSKVPSNCGTRILGSDGDDAYPENFGRKAHKGVKRNSERSKRH